MPGLFDSLQSKPTSLADSLSKDFPANGPEDKAPNFWKGDSLRKNATNYASSGGVSKDIEDRSSDDDNDLTASWPSALPWSARTKYADTEMKKIMDKQLKDRETVFTDWAKANRYRQEMDELDRDLKKTGKPGLQFAQASEPIKSAYSKPGPYITKLKPSDEKNFQQWVKDKKIPWEESPTSDYDMRGFYKAWKAGDPRAVRSQKNGHFNDAWKTPYHKSFSNQSIYSLPNAPKWKGNKLIDKFGKVLVDETPVKKK